MRLGLSLGNQTAASTPADHLALAREADRLGLAVVWAAEAYGCDAVTMLAWIAGQTERIDLGSGIMQIPARTPTMTAMTAATLDACSGGRFRLGLGVSGPQVSEGWHGVPFAHPLARTREYVDVVRLVLDRREVAYQGEFHQLPLPGGQGKPLRLSFRPPRAHIPIYLAAIGPKNLELAGEIADGALVVFLSPEFAEEQLAAIRAGAAIRAAREVAGFDLAGFDLAATVPVVIGEDVAACAEPVRPYAALYLGGMGSRQRNFYHRLAVRMGYGEAADTVRELFLARRHRDAAAAVPLEFLDRTSLLGPVSRVAGRMCRYAEVGVGTLAVLPVAADRETALHTLGQAARAYELSGVGGASGDLEGCHPRRG